MADLSIIGDLVADFLAFLVRVSFGIPKDPKDRTPRQRRIIFWFALSGVVIIVVFLLVIAVLGLLH